MTGAEDLFSDPQPVTETLSALSLSGGVAGISPQKGSDETLARTQGKASPSGHASNSLTLIHDV